MDYKYEIEDVVNTILGVECTIKEKGNSYIDGKTVPSYWVLYSKTVFPDGQLRNLWENNITGKYE